MNKSDSPTRTGPTGIGTVGLLLSALSLLAFMSGCAKDSADKVDDANKKRIETQSAAISEDAKDDAVKMAGKLVDLAGMNITIRSLSEEAAKMATNPQVKTYAQKIVTVNRQYDAELAQLARTMNLQLPTSLTQEGKDRVADLKNVEPGTIYDLKYLDELGKVSKKSASVAEDLEDDGTTEAVKTYGEKVRKSLETQEESTKQLSNVIK